MRAADAQRSGLDRRLLHEIHARKFLLQIGVAFRLQTSLIRTAAAPRAFAIFGIELLDHIHARHDLAEWCESLPVQRGVIAEVDEYLTGAGVRSRHRISHEAALVALLDRIVRDARLTPFGRK